MTIDGTNQFNTGTGTFIGGNNYGTVQTLDPTTKKLIAKLAQQAPPLAALLERALREGFVSPDVAYALQRAAWSINEDVAISLMRASDRINEDVANSLSFTADNLSQSATDIGSGATRLENAIDTGSTRLENTVDNGVDRLIAAFSTLDRTAYRIERATAPVRVLDWEKIKMAFITGLVLGAALMGGIIYMLTHEATN